MNNCSHEERDNDHVPKELDKDNYRENDNVNCVHRGSTYDRLSLD